MKFTLTDKLIAYLCLFSGLCISAVAEYYSIMGLMAIFAAAVVPIIVMGVALGVSKLVATVWIKTNWSRAPFLIKTYLLAAIAILMLITSMGIFGFLSKAHSDQSLVSGDVQAKIAVYDEKIKTEKENIEANRKALKQMDEGVDQVLGRSADEKGADKAVALRRSQQKERARLQAEISQSQKSIAELNDARAPIAAEVRKVEAEVGPIKYIANFIYGDNPDANILDKAVTWVIVIIVIVFDPLAVVLLLASQYSFQWFRKADEDEEDILSSKQFFVSEPVIKPVVVEEPVVEEVVPEVEESDIGEVRSESLPENVEEVYPLTEEEIEELQQAFETARRETRVPDLVATNNSMPYDVPAPPATTPIPLVIEEPLITIIEEPVFKEAVEAGIYNEDGTLVERPGDYVTPPQEFAPPGTPGEAWVAPEVSEQQAEDKLDKIYKTSAEELAKQQRSRGWFQATLPKKDN